MLKFIVTFNDNTTKTTYGKLKVYVPNTYSARGFVSQLDTIFADTSDLLYQGYDESIAYQGQNEFRIYYDNLNNDQIVNKPIFIIDGYDPGDIRKIEIFDPGHDSEKSIKQLMSYDIDNNPDNGNDKDLVENLRDEGFDVIIVNHHKYINKGKEIDGGSDYIQRNAYAFISLLRYINNIKQGNEKNIVIGPSMGGLISRYALAYMEKQLSLTRDNAKWNHETKLWVSFDSPHQGANIPIGVQKGIQYFADELNNEGAKDFIKQLDQPAPKQMLVNHYTNNTNLLIGAPNFRNRFQNELNSLGMPQNLRKIALINGSIFGNLNGIPEGEYLKIVGQQFFGFGEGEFDFFHTNNRNSGSQNLIFYGRKKVKWNVFGLFTITHTFGRKKYYSLPKPKGSFDVSPGGYYNSQVLLAEEAYDFGFFAFWSNVTFNLFDPTHSFIPTKSALAYTGSNVLDEVIGNKNRVCTGETPFDSYFAPQNNEEHISLTAKNVAWLTEEIMGNPQDPSIYIRPFTIQGDKIICYSEYKTYTIDNRISSSCQDATQWAVSDNLTIISQNNNSITVRPVSSSANGLGWISAEREGEKTISHYKNIWVGKPLDEFANFRLVGTLQILSGQWSSLEASVRFFMPEYGDVNSQNHYEYEWNIPNAQIRYTDNKRIANIYPYSTGSINIGFRLKNRCGCSNWNTRQFNVRSQGGGNTGGGILIPTRQ